MKKFLTIHLLSLLLFVSCNKTDNDTPTPGKSVPVEPDSKEISCSLQSIKYSYGADSFGDIEYRYTTDASGNILAIKSYTLDLNALLNQSIIEYNDKKQPIKVTYQEFYSITRIIQGPLSINPVINGNISLFTYDDQGRLASSKVSYKNSTSSSVQNTTFEYSTDKVVATRRTEGESQDTYTLITFDYKEENLIKTTLQSVSATLPYSNVDEYQYAQEINKNNELNKINALVTGIPIASKNLVKYVKFAYSSQLPIVKNFTYTFNEHGFVTSINGNTTYTYGCQ